LWVDANDLDNNVSDKGINMLAPQQGRNNRDPRLDFLFYYADSNIEFPIDIAPGIDYIQPHRMYSHYYHFGERNDGKTSYTQADRFVAFVEWLAAQTRRIDNNVVLTNNIGRILQRWVSSRLLHCRMGAYFDYMLEQLGLSSMCYPEITSYSETELKVVNIESHEISSYYMLSVADIVFDRRFNYNEISHAWVVNEEMDKLVAAYDYYVNNFTHPELSQRDAWEFALMYVDGKTTAMSLLKQYFRDDATRYYTTILPNLNTVSTYHIEILELAHKFFYNNMPLFGIAPYFFMGHIPIGNSSIFASTTVYDGPFDDELSESDLINAVYRDSPDWESYIRDILLRKRVIKINVPVRFNDNIVSKVPDQPEPLITDDQMNISIGTFELYHVLADDPYRNMSTRKSAFKHPIFFSVPCSSYYNEDINFVLDNHFQETIRFLPYKFIQPADIKLVRIDEGLYRF
jgi:hypothetical protein